MAKITWLSVNAYTKCNSQQKDFFLKHYGNDSKDSVNKIIDLYEELELPKLYEETKRELHNEIIEGIKYIPDDVVPHELFHILLKNMRDNFLV